MSGGSAKKFIPIYFAMLFLIFAGAYTYEVLCGFFDVRYVATSSMEPSFPRGSLIVIVKDPYGIAIGDPIVYRYPQAPNRLLFHRVVDISGNSIYVKGDVAATVEAIGREYVYGVYLFGVPYIGFVREALIRAPFFPYLLVIVVAVILLYTL